MSEKSSSERTAMTSWRKWAMPILAVWVLIVGGLLLGEANKRATVERVKQERIEQDRILQAKFEQDRLDRERRKQEEIQAHRTRITSLQTTLDQVQADSNALDSAVKTYMMEHSEAVIAIAAGVGGSNVAFDSSNQYSDEAKAVGGITAAVAAVWALQNMDEVREVSGELSKASVRKTDYTNQMNSLRQSIAEEEQKIADLERS